MIPLRGRDHTDALYLARLEAIEVVSRMGDDQPGALDDMVSARHTGYLLKRLTLDQDLDAADVQHLRELCKWFAMRCDEYPVPLEATIARRFQSELLPPVARIEEVPA